MTGRNLGPTASDELRSCRHRAYVTVCPIAVRVCELHNHVQFATSDNVSNYNHSRKIWKVYSGHLFFSNAAHVSLRKQW